MKKGFTLVELLVVIILVAVLVAIALPRYMDAVYRGKVAACKQNISDLNTAIQAYQAKMADQSFPADLAALVSEGFHGRFAYLSFRGRLHLRHRRFDLLPRGCIDPFHRLEERYRASLIVVRGAGPRPCPLLLARHNSIGFGTKSTRQQTDSLLLEELSLQLCTYSSLRRRVFHPGVSPIR